MYPVILIVQIDATCGGERIAHLVTSSHRATQGPTNPNMLAAGRLLTKHRVEGDQLEDVNWIESQLGRNPVHPFIADETEVFLPQMEQGHGRTALTIDGITSYRLLHVPLQLGGNVCARRVHENRKLIRQSTVF